MNSLKQSIKTNLWCFREYLRYWIRPLQLDIHIVEHCNLNCVSCMHYSTIANPEFCNKQELKENLSILHKFQKCFKVIQLMGGEPLLNPEICEILEISRTFFDKIKIKLATNGILLKSMPEDFWESCKKNNIIISVTIYPIKLDYTEIESLCLAKGVKYEVMAFRTGEEGFYASRVNPNGGKPVKLKFLKCQSSGCLQLKGNKIFACPQSAYIEHLNKKFNLNFEQRDGDYVRIDKMKSSLQLRRLRASTKPFCFYCELRGKGFAWRQSEKIIKEWVKY